ncbi:MAG: hypothetical protein KA004_13165 [Verrucomicrobiales bacterium]|nr:hypothetical protein [Verrucomicrobiales bacterium]
MDFRRFKKHAKPATLGLLWAFSLAVAYHFGHSPPETPSDAAASFPPTRDFAPANGRPTDGSHSSRETRTTTAARNAEEDDALRLTPEEVGTFDPEGEFAEVMSRPPGPLRNRALRDLFEKWGEADGEGALAKLRTIQEPLLRFELREATLRHWAMADPEAAWIYALANKAGELPDNRMQTVLAGLARGDIQVALRFFENHSAKGDLKNYFDGAVYAFDKLYQRGGHDQLVGWVEGLPASKMRDGALNRVVDQWARYDPEKAKAWMEKMLVSNKENTGPARLELAESWARVNPNKALEWVNGLPVAERNGEYYNAIYRRWLDYDQNGAAQFLAAQPPSPQLDRAFERYASEVAARNPAETIAWSESITDERRRWRSIERVAEVWRRQDFQGLTNYVNSRNFTTDQRKALLGKK